MASYPPSNLNPKRYDVFLSFRGEDIRYSFIDQVYKALADKGFCVFRDDLKLPKGERISFLFDAIESSRVAVVVFSSNYANSHWCLDEVAKIVDCRNESGLLILPVFYDVVPADVRKQTGTFKEHFDEHERKFKDDVDEKVKRWRKALNEVGSLSGYTLKDRPETVVIQEIVDRVFSYLDVASQPAFSTVNTKNFIGMGRVRDIESKLREGPDEVRVIGICGMPGVGKTTIAQVVFQRNWYQFGSSCFIDNVKDTGVLEITKKVCSDLLKSEVTMQNVNLIMANRFHSKKVLIVLDDVDGLKQIEAIAGMNFEELKKRFVPGSRIIITTRNESLLERYGETLHRVEKLTHEESLVLFCRKAFLNDYPEEEFSVLSDEFVKYADCLPLALEVVGSALYEKSLEEWSSFLKRLSDQKYTGQKDVMDILRTSFDSLDGRSLDRSSLDGRLPEKEIFLDVACFFRGEDVSRMERIFESCGYHPTSSIPILLQKSMIKIIGGKLWMHDLLQQMGREKVIEESKWPGKRSRLWHCTVAHDVLTQNEGTTAVQGIFLVSADEKKDMELEADPFSKMCDLKILKIKNVKVSEKLEPFFNQKKINDCRFRELRFLEWHAYPLRSLPSSFKADKLVELHLPRSNIEHLWEETSRPPESLNKLVTMDLSDCKCLTRSPNFKGIKELVTLNLKGCEKLSQLHASVGDLNKLILLNLEGCECLTILPDSICSLASLTTLILSGCCKLEKLPEIGESMKQLSELDLDGTAIKELPTSINHLTGLIRLSLKDCKKLLCLPADFGGLISLQVLNLSSCSNLDELPQNVGSLESLKELDASGSGIRRVPSSILLLKNLETLSFRGCRSLQSSIGLHLPNSFSGLQSLSHLDLSYCNLLEEAIPDDLGCLSSSLKVLCLSGNNFVRLPGSITNLSKLESLLLNDCNWLRSLPELPSSIRSVFARNCPLLEQYKDRLTLWTSTATGFSFINGQSSKERKLQRIPISEHHLLRRLLQNFYEDTIHHDNAFEYITCQTKIPKWFRCQSAGLSLTIQLPPDLGSNSAWMGFAMCFVYESLSSVVASLDDGLKFSSKHRCHIYTNEEDDRLPLVRELMDHNFGGLYQHWVYIPGGLFAKRLHNKRSLRTKIIIDNDRPGVLQFKACGARLVYYEDVPEFVWNLVHRYKQEPESRFLLEIEPHTSRDYSRSTQIVGDQSRTKVESLLEELFEPCNARQYDYGFIFSLRAILPWFSFQSIGGIFYPGGLANSIRLPFSPSLYNDGDWVGFAVYMSLITRPRNRLRHTNISLRILTSDERNTTLYARMYERIAPEGEKDFIGTHRVLVIHIPRARVPLTEEMKQCRFIQASVVSFPGVAIEICGMRLVHKKDLKGLIQTISHCALSSPPAYFGCDDKTYMLKNNGADASFAMDKSLIEAAKPRMISTSEEAFRDSESSCEEIELAILADIGLGENLYAIEWKRDIENLLKYFCRLSNLMVTLTCGGDNYSLSADNFYSGIFPEKEIPEWFEEKSPTFSLVSTPLPQNLEREDNWMGFFVCAAFSFHPPPADAHSYLDTELLCHFKWRYASVEAKKIVISPENKFMWLCREGFIWLQYLPRHIFKGTFDEQSEAEVSFTSDCPALMVQECSFRVLYKKDLEEFKKTTIHCFTSFFDHEDVIPPYMEEGCGLDMQPNQADRRHSCGSGRVLRDSQHERETTSYLGETRVNAQSIPLKDVEETCGITNDQLEVTNVAHGSRSFPEQSRFFLQIAPPASSDSNPLNITGQLRRNIKSLLEQLLKGDIARRNCYGFILSPNVREIYPWFNYQSIGNAVCIYQPPADMYNNEKWVGVTLYVAMTVPPGIEVTIRCQLLTCTGNVDHFLTQCRHQDKFIGSRRLCFIHIPRSLFTKGWTRSSLEASFDICDMSARTIPGVEVQMCGIRVVYEQDLEGLIQTIAHCTITSPPVYYTLGHEILHSLPGRSLVLINMIAILLEVAKSLPVRFHSSDEPLRDPQFGRLHLSILGDLPLQKRGDPLIKWKQNLKLLLRSFFRLADVTTYLILGPFFRVSDTSSDLILGQEIISSFRGFDRQSAVFPVSEIPDWFRERSPTCRVVCTLPPNLGNDNNWLGFVVCASFSVHPHPTEVRNYLDSEIDYSSVECHLKWGNDSATLICRKVISMAPRNRFMWLYRRECIWLNDISADNFKGGLNGHAQLEASFTSGSPALAVQKCSIRLLYKQDIEEYKQTMIHCITSLFDEDVILPITAYSQFKPNHTDERDSYGTAAVSPSENSQDEGDVFVFSETSGSSKAQDLNSFSSMLLDQNQLLDFNRSLIYNSCFPLNEIIGSFQYNSNGPSITIPLPPNLCGDANWIGLAFCASFSVPENLSVDLDNMLDPGISHHLTCYFETDMGSLEPLHVYRTTNQEFQWTHLGGFIWLSHIPRTWFLDRLSGGFLEASIASDHGAFTVNKCGFSHVYQQDEEEFIQTIMLCMTSLSDISKEKQDHNQGGVTSIAIGSRDQDFDCSSTYNACFPPNDIVAWFGHHSEGPSVKIPLPPHLYRESANWIGLALCAYFSVSDYLTPNIDHLDPEIPHHLTCYLESDTGNLDLCHSYITTNTEFKWLHLGGFLWISYIPGKSLTFDHPATECINLEASIGSDFQRFGVLKCGLRLLYQHDEQEFRNTIMHCVNSLSDQDDGEYKPSLPDNSKVFSGEPQSEILKRPKSDTKGKGKMEDQEAAGRSRLSAADYQGGGDSTATGSRGQEFDNVGCIEDGDSRDIEPNHIDERKFQDSEDESKTAVPVSQSGDSINHFNSILFEPVLYDNQAALIWADLQGWEE